MASDLILLRCTVLGEREAALAEELEAASGAPVAFLLDGRHAQPALARGRDRILLTQAACEALGLYCPPDFAWRCGDYGLYLALQAFPAVQRFWLVEYDVRFVGGARGFFDFFAGKDADFLGVAYRRAGPDWDWYRHGLGRGTSPSRCLFPLLRVSRRAAERLLEKRREHGRSPQRRRVWPNDEALTATTLASEGFACADFNAFGRRFYDEPTFSVVRPLDGDRLPQVEGEVRAYHPVLFGSAYEEKVRRLAAKGEHPSLVRRMKSRLRQELNRFTPW